MRYRLRQLIVGILFIIFAIFCILGNLFFIPIVLLGLNRNKYIESFCRDLVYISWGIFIKICRFFGYIEFNIDKEIYSICSGGNLIISNHPSLLDIVFMLSLFKRANCIVKSSLKANFLLSWTIRACNYILNTDDDSFLQDAILSLKNGENLIIFPEGTRTKNCILMHKSGAYLAVKAAKNTVLIFIDMQPRSLKKSQPWYKTPDKTIKYNIEILEQFCDNFLIVKNMHIKICEIYKRRDGGSY